MVEEAEQLTRVAAEALHASGVVLAAFLGGSNEVISVHPPVVDAEHLACLAGRLRRRSILGPDAVVPPDGLAALLVPDRPPQEERYLQLHTSDGEVAGFLWVGDDGSLPWDASRTGLLDDIAALATGLLHLRWVAGAEAAAHHHADLLAGRLDRLQRATAALSRALTADEAVRAIVQEAMDALGAQQGSVALIDTGGSMLRMTYMVGLAEDVREHWLEFPLASDVPMAIVARTGESMWFDSREQLTRCFPAVAQTVEVSPRQAWAFVPIRSFGGSAGGVLMVSWTQPRLVTSDERLLLESLADWCGPVLRRAGLYDRAAGTAAVLQTSLLPPALPLLEGLDIHARYVPSHRSDVGGDFYDVFALPEGRVGMVVGDAVGHGIAAATQMGQARHALRTLAFVEGDPLRVLELFDAKVAQFGENLMVTATVVFLDRQTGRIRYAQAGHPPGMIRRRNGRVTVLGSPQRPPLGVRATPRPGTASAEAEVHPGDTLVLYTDGLIERVGEPLDTGLARLEAALVSIPTDLNAAAERLLQELVAFGGDDDLALLLARRG